MAISSKSFIQWSSAAYRPFLRQLRLHIRGSGRARCPSMFRRYLSIGQAPKEQQGKAFHHIQGYAFTFHFSIIQFFFIQGYAFQNHYLRTSPLPCGRGKVLCVPTGSGQPHQGDAVLIRQVAVKHQVKDFRSFHGKARYCRHLYSNGSSHHLPFPSHTLRQAHNVREPTPSPADRRLRRRIVRWRGQATAWLSEIVWRSIAFRLFGLLLRQEYATSLNPCRASFLWKGIGHIATSVDKSDASFRESASTRATATGEATYTFLHVSPKHLHFIPRPTISRLRQSSPPNNAPPTP